MTDAEIPTHLAGPPDVPDKRVFELKAKMNALTKRLLAAEKQLKALELANREEAKRLDAAKKAAKEAAASVRPQDMFKDRETKYAAFDADGVPTHDAANEPLSKSLLK